MEARRISSEVEKCPNCGHRLIVRTTAQNAKLHSLLGDIARQKQWAGIWLGVEDWKRLLTAAWLRVSGGQVRVLPSLDGTGVDVLYQHTSKLSKLEMSELIEFVQAWAADNGIETTNPL